MIANTRVDRREAMRFGALAGIGALLPTGIARGADNPTNLMPNLTAMVERWVGPDKFPGIVAVLGMPGREAQFLARGSEGFADADPVGPDSLFRLYSMTKPITGMAAMMLIADGKLGLDQPLADILPKFARMQVLVTPDGPITDVRAAKTPILIRHLLTHTAGIGYLGTQNSPLKVAAEEAGLAPALFSRTMVPEMFVRAVPKNPVNSLAEFADRVATLPLVYEPGTVWTYNYGLDVLARVMEVVSGRPFDAFLRERLLAPLGMNSTFFQVPASEARRLTTNHTVVADRMVPIDPGVGSIYTDKPAFPFASGGLVSSPRDYDRFLRMLAQYGVIDGKRVMSELAVRVGTSELMPEGVDTRDMARFPARASGAGAGGGVGIGSEAGTYGWTGAAGTIGTVNLKYGIRSALFLQFTPTMPFTVISEYEEALRADVTALTGKL